MQGEKKESRHGKLDGKVAVITGATSGMAPASAKLFVEEGAFVFITGEAILRSSRISIFSMTA